MLEGFFKALKAQNSTAQGKRASEASSETLGMEWVSKSPLSGNFSPFMQLEQA